MKFKVMSNRITEMARIGNYDDVEVVVFTDDPGNIPHFHLRDFATRGQKFHSCIRITEPAYFKHTGKTDVLNSRDKKDLIEFLQQQTSSKLFNGTNWQLILYMWNLNNSSVQVDEELPMPDYTKL